MQTHNNAQDDLPAAEDRAQEDHTQAAFSDPSATQPATRLEYTGTWDKIMRLAAWNALWTILTLGIFRFWAKTRIRRHFWSNTVIDGDALEYTGRGLELFLGFLIVTVCASPFVALFVYLRTQIPLDNIVLNTTIDFLVWLPIIFLIQIAVYRAQKYRLSRTSWRGIRGHLNGSSIKYAGKALLALLVTSLTLGICKPYYDITLMNYERNNTLIGNAQLSFAGKFTPAFKKWLTIWFMLLLTYIVTFPAFAALVKFSIVLAFVVLAAGALFAAYQYSRYQAWFFRYTTGETSLGNLALSSDLQAGKLFRIYTVLAIAVVLTFVLIFMAFSIAIGLTVGASVDPSANAGPLVAIAVVSVMMLGPVQKIFLLPMFFQPLIAAKVSSISVDGEMNTFAIEQVQRAEPRTGEGLAEAFDLGGI